MLDILTAAPKEVRFGNRTLRIGPLKLRELGLLQRWVREHSVRPTVAVKEVMDLLAEESEKRKAALAAVIEEKSWPPVIGTEAGNRVLLSDLDGQRYFLSVFLRKYQPDLADAALDEVLAGISIEDMTFLFQVAFGEDDFDPEALRAEIRRAFRAIDRSELHAIAALLSESESTTDSSSAA